MIWSNPIDSILRVCCLMGFNNDLVSNSNESTNKKYRLKKLDGLFLRGHYKEIEESENQADLFSKDLFWPKLQKLEKWGPTIAEAEGYFDIKVNWPGWIL